MTVYRDGSWIGSICRDWILIRQTPMRATTRRFVSGAMISQLQPEFNRNFCNIPYALSAVSTVLVRLFAPTGRFIVA